MIKNVKDSLKTNRASLIVGPLLKVIEAIFDLLIPLFMKAVIDLTKFKEISLIPSSNKISIFFGSFIRLFGCWVPGNQALSDALVTLVIILSMGLLGFIITMITQYIAAKTASKVGTEVRNSLFEKIMSFSSKEKEAIGTSKLLTVTNSDTYSLQQGILFFIRLIVRAPFIILGALIISFILDWRIGLVFAAIVPLILLIVFLVMHKSSKKYISIQEKLDDISTISDDSFEGIKSIKAFNKEKYQNKKFDSLSSNYHQKAINVNRINSLINPLTFAVVSIAIILVTLIGGNTILSSTSEDGALMASTIIAEVAYLSQIFVTLVILSNVILVLTKAKVSVKRINEVLTIKPSINNSQTSSIVPDNYNKKLIEFNDVFFAYSDNENYALKHITFSFKKGQSFGIIGGTGSGKSSLINLIERFSDCSKGNINYKGIDIKNYSLNSLRNEIGLVPQKSILFKGTIKSNLIMGNSKLSESIIIEALKVAEAYEFVSQFSDFLDHHVDEGGKNFSGGQRQRLCLARAILKSPELLILDDSTSALDLLTEKKVKENLSEHFPRITKVIVSQRISSVSNCDQILVLDCGEVIAIGTHKELLKTCSIYKETYKTQIKEAF